MKFFVLVLLFTFTIFNARAQRIDFRLRNSSPLYANPANTGTYDHGRINYGFLLPAYTLSSDFFINYLSYDRHFNKLRGGFGAEFLSVSPDFGGKSENHLALNYAFQQNLGEKLTLSVGLGINVKQEKINYNHQTWPIDCHGVPNIDENGYGRKTLLEPRFGAAVYSTNFFAGVHYTQSKYMDYCLLRAYPVNVTSGYMGYALKTFKNKNLSFIPSIHYSRQNQFQQYGLQLTFNTARFSVGSSIYPGNYYAFMAGVNFWQMRLKYSYSNTLSPLTNTTAGQNELSLQFDFPNTVSRKSSALTLNLF